MTSPLQLLSESVAYSMEAKAKGSKFPIFQACANGKKDQPLEKIPGLLAEIRQIYNAFMDGNLRLSARSVQVLVPIHNTGYVPELGIPIDKDSREIIGLMLNNYLDQCELAVFAGAGFGKFSAKPEAIAVALKQLQQKPVEFIAQLPGGATTVRIIAFDSNNDMSKGVVADGMWIPFQAIGLVAWSNITLNDNVLAFRAKMDYKTNQWKIGRLDSEFLVKLLPKMPTLPKAYQTLTGNALNPDGLQKMADAQVILQLRASPHFQQALNRVCSRWVM